MKIVKTTDTSLKVIPRSYPDTVDLSIRNERTNITTEETDIAVTSDGGYLDIPLTSDVVSGVKCISANNEYLSSQAGNYFPNDINNVDIEVDFSDYTKISGDLFLIYQGDAFGTNKISLSLINSEIQFDVTNGGVAERINYDTGLSYPFSGNIKLLGNGTSVNLLWNNVIVGNLAFTNQHTTTLNPLSFNAQYFISGSIIYILHQDVTFEYIKINNHEWTSSNWTAPTTTNSEGVITTLNSDVSTSAMIQSTIAPIYTFTENNNYDFEVSSEGERIYKGKIFCTDQTDYSINEGRYTERVVTRNYITR